MVLAVFSPLFHTIGDSSASVQKQFKRQVTFSTDVIQLQMLITLFQSAYKKPPDIYHIKVLGWIASVQRSKNKLLSSVWEQKRKFWLASIRGMHTKFIFQYNGKTFIYRNVQFDENTLLGISLKAKITPTKPTPQLAYSNYVINQRNVQTVLPNCRSNT